MFLFIYCYSKTCQVPQNPCLSIKARKKCYLCPDRAPQPSAFRFFFISLATSYSLPVTSSGLPKHLQIFPRACISPINILSMAHSDHFNHQFITLNLIDHTIFSRTDSMNIHSSNQLRGTDRKRIPCEGFNGLQNLKHIPLRKSFLVDLRQVIV